MNSAVISGLYIYPIKSCRGIALDEASVLTTGLAQDRRWMVVDATGKFVTQREQPRMALIAPELQRQGLQITAPGMSALMIEGRSSAHNSTVTVWRDQVAAVDEGNAAAVWFSAFLGVAVRLVRFADDQIRLSSRDFTGDVAAYQQFSDGFAILVIGEASLQDLNSRLPTPLPMNRFRPNVVLAGLPAYAEDALHELRGDALCLRLVKPCTRCKITTIDQATGISHGTEPLSTLMKFRRDPVLRGVTFGQNAIVLRTGQLKLGQSLQVTVRTDPVELA
jgi:uncharacterized protein